MEKNLVIQSQVKNLSLRNFYRFFKEKLKPPLMTYGILPVCRRCVYGKHFEPILVYSFNRGVRCLVNYNGKTFTRRGECPDFRNCMNCLDAIEHPKKYSCIWIEI